MARPPYSRSSSAREVTDILDSQNQDGGRGFANVLDRARQLQRLDDLVSRQLPEELVPHVHVASLSSGELTLLTNSAGYATRLRIQSADLCRRLSEVLDTDVSSVRVRVSSFPADSKPAERPRKLSQAALDGLQRMAAMSDDEEIRSTVDRLERKASRE